MIKFNLSCPYKVDYFNYYKSETPFDLNNMPEPTVSNITNLEFIDENIIIGSGFYVIFGSVKNDIEKYSTQEYVISEHDYVPISFISSTYHFSDSSSVLIKEPIHNNNDILIALVAGYSNIIVPDGYTLITSKANYYILYKIFNGSSSSEISIDTGITWGVTHSILLRPNKTITKLDYNYEQSSYNKAEESTFSFTYLVAKNNIKNGFLLNSFRWHNRNVYMSEDIIVPSGYTIYQKRYSNDGTSAVSAMCSFGKSTIKDEIITDANLSMSSLPNPTSLDSISVHLYAY